MTNVQDPFDTVIEQIEQNDKPITCEKCLCGTTNLLKTSCNHTICLECIESLIEAKDYTHCTICQGLLQKNLHKMFTEYLANPLNNLQYCHDMVCDDILWYYEGNGHNWLYSKENCIDIDDAFQKYNQDDGPSTLEIKIDLNGKSETYIVDFENKKQYPKNAPNKKRGISYFKLKSINDLKKYKIIGVAGKLL